MRLLSFLSDIERALVAGSPSADSGGWQTTRMVNFQQGLARLALQPRNPAELVRPAGAIFLQAFALADGSVCLKASLTWKGSDAFPALAVYSTPTLNWQFEAARVATAWLEGPPAATATLAPQESLYPLAAQAG